ncbi:MAG TPA: outer membrane protein transport protein, partial [Gemmatimonadaceae bacterium]
EIGSCAVGRAFAATASPCRDASTIFWNSAAATQLTGWNVTAGAAAVSLQGSFKEDTTRKVFESNVPTEYIPHAFVNYHKANTKLAYGLGVYVPYGLTTQWNNDFPGRFVALRASLRTVYVQPNIAWQINSKWSVGGGPIWGHSSVELTQAVDLSTQQPLPGVTFANLGIARGTEFARAKLEGSATAFGAQIAVLGQPARGWNVGLRFLTPLEFKYDDADASFSQVFTGLIVGGTLPGTPFQAGTPIDSIVAPQFRSGGLLVPQNASTKITHPAQIQGGVAYSGWKNWLFEADVAWVGWKRFKELPLDFSGSNALDRVLIEDYNNSTAFRLAAEYTIPTDGWTLRTGYSGVASAAPDETVTPLLPEQDRAYWTFGASIPFGKTFALDAGYAHVFTPGARGRIVERLSREQTAAQLNTGVYSLTANVISLSVKASF